MRWLWSGAAGCALFLAQPVWAQPLVYRGEETLWQDTVWSGEVLIDGILTVAPNVTLEIRPGTTVRVTTFDSNGDGIGEHELFVQGVVRALGTDKEPIRFTSAAEHPAAGDWGAVNLMGAETASRFEHCRFEYAYRGFHAHFARAVLRDDVFSHNVRGLQFQESQVELRRCRISENRNGIQFRDSQVQMHDCTVSDNAWGVRGVYSSGTLVACRIEGNLINGVNLRDAQFEVRDCLITGNRRGLYLQRGTVTVQGNRILANSEHGIFLEQTRARVMDNRLAGNGRAGVRVEGADLVLQRNDLSEPGTYALVNDGAAPLDARGNWWGTTDLARIEALVRDGRDRPGCGPVDFSAPLIAPPQTTAPPGALPE